MKRSSANFDFSFDSSSNSGFSSIQSFLVLLICFCVCVCFYTCMCVCVCVQVFYTFFFSKRPYSNPNQLNAMSRTLVWPFLRTYCNLKSAWHNRTLRDVGVCVCVCVGWWWCWLISCLCEFFCFSFLFFWRSRELWYKQLEKSWRFFVQLCLCVCVCNCCDLSKELRKRFSHLSVGTAVLHKKHNALALFFVASCFV